MSIRSFLDRSLLKMVEASIRFYDRMAPAWSEEDRIDYHRLMALRDQLSKSL